MRKLMFLFLVETLIPLSLYAEFAKDTECVLPTKDGLKYKGYGDLDYKEYGSCSNPFDKYATCYFGYESVQKIEVRAGGGSGAFCVNYGPYVYIYAGVTEDNMEQVVEYYLGASWYHDWHTITYENIPANYKYFKVRFKRGGSAACGSSKFDHFYVERTNSFQLEDKDGNKIDDNGTFNVKVNTENVFRVNLFSVKRLPTKEPIFLDVFDADNNKGSDYIRIENKVFPSLTDDKDKSGYFQLIDKTYFRVNFRKNGTYKVYFEIRSGKDMIIQRRYITFQVSD